MKLRTALCLAAGIASPLFAQTSRSASPPVPADAVSVDSILAALYASVSHPSDREADWARLREICLPVGMFIPPKKPTEDLFTVLDVDGFQERVRKGAATLKAKGEPTGFEEREIARRADCFGNVCQIFSTYEGRRAPSDEKPFVRGINSIQLVRDGKRWWIASVVWDTERPDNPIPPAYLTKAIPAEYLKKN
ncbi:MAG: nuclear transport factor 2 family protein [Acidobacteriota bacterium]|nr:nuclear transport factor 2 family protein [Acidobacteriota bacterium]